MEANEVVPDIIAWGMSVFLMAMGALCRKYPDLIAGYNTMSADKKKNVDGKGLGKHMCNAMGWTAIACLVCYYLLKCVDVDEKVQFLVPYVVVWILGLVIASIKAKKYDHNR